MAGYTSTPRQYGEYIQPYNIDLIAKALSYKQQKYDIADANLRQEINQIGSLDIMKGIDKSYLLSRLSNMVGDVNNLGALDLSDSGIVKNLDNHISQSVDSNVLNAFESTKQYRAFQQSIEKLKEDGKGLYNPLNEAYALQPVNEYMKSDKVGEKLSSFGSLQYTPYTDIEGEISKEMDGLLKNMKDGKIKMPDPNDPRQIIERDVRGMDTQEIRAFVGNMVSSKYDAQARINNWGRYQGYSAQGLAQYRNDVEKVIEKKNFDYDSKLLKLETERNSVKDKGQDYSEIDSVIHNLKIEKDNLKSLKNNMLSNPQYAGGLLEREIIVDRLSAKYDPFLRKMQDSVVGKNEVYYAELENQYKNNLLQIQQAELDLKRKKDQREDLELNLKIQGKLNGDGTSGAKEGTVNSGISIGPSTSDDLQKEDRDFEADYVKSITDTKSIVDSMIKQSFDYVTREAANGNIQAKTFLKLYDSKRGNKHNGALFRQLFNQHGAEYGLNIVEDSRGNKLFERSDLLSKVEEFNNISKTYRDIRQKFYGKEFDSIVNSSDFLENLNEEGQINVATPEGLYNLKNLAVSRGVLSKDGRKLKNISQDAMLKNTIKANIELGQIEFGRQSNIGSPTSRIFKPETIKILSDIYKEDLSYINNTGGRVDLTMLKNKSPKTYMALINYEKNGANNTAASSAYHSREFGTNNRVIQDSVFRDLQEDRLLSSEEKLSYVEELKKAMPGVSVFNKVYMYDKKNPYTKEIIAQALRFGTSLTKGGTDLNLLNMDDINDISFRLADMKNGELKVDINYNGPGSNGKKQRMVTSVNVDVESLKRAIPGFMDKISFQDKNYQWSSQALSGKSIMSSSDGITFLNPNANFKYNAKFQSVVQQNFGNSPAYEAVVSGITKDGAERFLANKFDFRNNENRIFYKDILSLQTDEQTKLKLIQEKQNQYINLAKKIVEDSKNYVLSSSFVNDGQYAIELKNKNGVTLAGTIHNGDNLENIHKLLTDYESSAYVMFLSQIIDNERSGLLQGASGFSQNFKNITGIK